jgi:hypothetical protein
MAQFKNETANLKVWIEHYIWQGVRNFFLIDNGSTDNPLQILNEYIKRGIVKYYYKPERHSQVENYRWVFDIENMKTKTYWLIVCDLDEFIYGVDKKLIKKLSTLEYYNLIYCNWLMFGSEKLINHPEDIRTSILHRELKLHQNRKYIFKPLSINNSSQVDMHGINYYGKNEIISSGKKVWIANKLIRLNHYPIQSWEFFSKVKMTRGDASSVNSDNIRDKNYFNRYDENCTFVDDILKKLIENPPENY